MASNALSKKSPGNKHPYVCIPPPPFPRNTRDVPCMMSAAWLRFFLERTTSQGGFVQGNIELLRGGGGCNFEWTDTLRCVIADAFCLSVPSTGLVDVWQGIAIDGAPVLSVVYQTISLPLNLTWEVDLELAYPTDVALAGWNVVFATLSSVRRPFGHIGWNHTIC